jgi:two-component system cell cycle sensor histidine kinase/response regulator CckA
VIVYLSPAIERSLGTSADELLGSVIWELVHPDDVETVQRMLRDISTRDDVGPVEFQMRHVDGSWRVLEAQAEPFDGERSQQVSLSCRDVTDQRRAEAASRDRDEQLRQSQKMDVIGRLASGIAHDFNNLLTIMIDASGQLLAGLPLEAALRAHAESIHQSALRAASMTRQLLGFSRLQLGGPAVVDLNDVIEETAQLLRRLIGEQLELRTILEPDLWPVVVNRTHIDQVLLNLAVNARDAMPSGGRLTIETRNVSADSMASHDPPIHGPHVMLIVSDTGMGMDEVTRDRAFEPFFTTKDSGKGTGLGLATVRRIVEQHGGWAKIASTPGFGTAVTVGLPRAEQELEPRAAPAPLSPPAPTTSPTGDETVLLVEDEGGVRELVRDILELAGYRVLEAPLPSVAERISREFEGPIDLLLTDVVMPEMSGLELVTRLQADGRRLQVMYMSGYSEPTTRDGGGVPPGAYFLSKPFQRHTLLRRVREALDGIPPSEGH